jgi:hypothetical protein
MFLAAATADWHTRDPNACKHGPSHLSMSIRAHCKWRKFINPQSSFLVRHRNQADESNFGQGVSVRDHQTKHSNLIDFFHNLRVYPIL